MRRRLSQIAFERGGLIALVVLALYAVLAAPQIVDGDNAELATLGDTGGIAHPSGYPLYLIWLRATAWLPGSAAHASAIATAILAAASVLVLHAACRAWGARPAAATVAVGIFAGGFVALRIATEAEVFALNDLVAASVLWLAAPRGPLTGGRRVIALALVAGLGLSNHLTCVLVAPVGILGCVRGLREGRARAAIGCAAIGALLVGLSPYLYLLAQPETAMSWGALDGAGALLDHVLRRDYGGPGAFGNTGEHVGALANLAGFATTLARGWLWLPALAGLAMLAIRACRGDDRWGFAALALAFLLAGPLLVLRFDVPPDHLGVYIAQRFHLLPTLLLAIPVALAIDRIPVSERLLSLAAFAALAVATAVSLPRLWAIHSPALERGLVGILGALPPDAVVFAGSDDFHFGSIYVAEELGVRRDVTVVTWSLTGLPWYRARLAARGVAIGAGDRPATVAERLLAARRPVYCDAVAKELRGTFPTYPYLGLFHVLAHVAPAPTIDEVIEENRRAYSTLDLDYPRPGPEDEYATIMRSRLAETWWLLGKALERAGKRGDAEYEVARQIGPE